MSRESVFTTGRFALFASRQCTIDGMIDVVRNEADRTVGERELHAARMRASEPAHIPPATRNATGRDARRETPPIPVDLHTGDRPVAFAVPSHAIAVHRRGLANEERVAGAIGDIF